MACDYLPDYMLPLEQMMARYGTVQIEGEELPRVFQDEEGLVMQRVPFESESGRVLDVDLIPYDGFALDVVISQGRVVEKPYEITPTTDQPQVGL